MKRSQMTGSAGGPPTAPEEAKPAAEPATAPTLAPSFIPGDKETSRVMTQVVSPPPHLGWHSRGYLPHWDHPGMIQGITYRLCDAVPAELISKWKSEINLRTGRSGSPVAALPTGSAGGPPAASSTADRAAGPAALPVEGNAALTDPGHRELAKRIARYEDAGRGACWLRDRRIGQMVEANLLHFDGERYRLLSWCVMPNHVHVMVETWEGWPLADLVHSWKSYTAHEANRILNRRGEFWQREYYDRYIRNVEHYLLVIRYIEENPVKARLVTHPAEWPWSSAKIRVARSAGGPPAVPAEAKPAAGPTALPDINSRES
jgi:REP element-mobilizing transposase RayT